MLDDRETERILRDLVAQQKVNIENLERDSRVDLWSIELAKEAHKALDALSDKDLKFKSPSAMRSRRTLRRVLRHIDRGW